MTGGLQSQSGQSGEEKNLVVAGNKITFSPQNSSCTHYANVSLLPYLNSSYTALPRLPWLLLPL